MVLPEDLLPLERVSAYFHIPFCRKKCTYCAFYSETGNSTDEMRQEVFNLLEQFASFQRSLNFPVIETVYIGGGTPSCLDRESLEILLKGIRSHLEKKEPAEWTIEANPESVDNDFLAILTEHGVTRLSVGIQSFQPHLRACLGRLDPEDSLEKHLSFIRNSWHGNLNLDIISGIPGQDLAGAIKDIETTVSYEPDHISLYTLSIEKGTALESSLKKGFYHLPGEETAEEMWLKAIERLESRGFERYEVSNFARPGRHCRHNMAYWSMRPYTGCGPTAVSTLPGAKGPVRLTVNRTGQLERENLSPHDFLIDYLLMGLRTARGVELNDLDRLFHPGVFRQMSGLVSEWQNRGLLIHEDDRIHMTGRGMSILDAFLREAMSLLARVSIDRIFWPHSSKTP